MILEMRENVELHYHAELRGCEEMALLRYRQWDRELRSLGAGSSGRQVLRISPNVSKSKQRHHYSRVTLVEQVNVRQCRKRNKTALGARRLAVSIDFWIDCLMPSLESHMVHHCGGVVEM